MRKRSPPKEPPVKRPIIAAMTPMIANIHAGMIFDASLAPLIEKIPSRRDITPRTKKMAMPDTPALSWLAPMNTIAPRIMRMTPQIIEKITKIFNISLPDYSSPDLC